MLIAEGLSIGHGRLLGLHLRHAVLLVALLVPAFSSNVTAAGAAEEVLRHGRGIPLARQARRGWPRRSTQDHCGSFSCRMLAALGHQSATRLANVWDVEYMGNIEMGEPSQTLSVIFDTGSSDLWVSSSFDHTRSSTLRCPQAGCEEDVSIAYAQGKVSGLIREDTVKIAGMSLRDQDFLLLSQAGGFQISGSCDGVMGLAFDRISNTKAKDNQASTVLDALGRAKEQLFSFYIAAREEQSWFFLGYPSYDLYRHRSLEWHPVVEEAWWSVEADMWIGSTHVLEKSFFALDTGSSYLGFPQDMFAKIYELLAPADVMKKCTDPLSSAGNFQCPCSVRGEFNIIRITIGHLDYPMMPRDYFLETGDGEHCAIELGYHTSQGLPIILGDTFLRTVMPIFDMKGKVGLAERSDRILHPRDYKRLKEDEDAPKKPPILPPYRPTLELRLWPDLLAVIVLACVAGVLLAQILQWLCHCIIWALYGAWALIFAGKGRSSGEAASLPRPPAEPLREPLLGGSV